MARVKQTATVSSLDRPIWVPTSELMPYNPDTYADIEREVELEEAQAA